MPLVYLLVGYWLPALVVREPNVRFEQCLLDIDRRLFGPDGLARFERRAPRAVIEYLELAYLLCYAVVPAGYACLLSPGTTPASSIDSGRLSCSPRSCVTGCCRGCRRARLAPSSRAATATRSSIRQLNLAVLNRASVQWNTFPSGHTAASLATALAVAAHMPLAGFVLGVDGGQHRRRQRGRPLSLRGRRDCGSCRGHARVRYGNRRARTVTEGRFTVTSRLFGGTSRAGRAYTI